MTVGILAMQHGGASMIMLGLQHIFPSFPAFEQLFGGLHIQRPAHLDCGDMQVTGVGAACQPEDNLQPQEVSWNSKPKPCTVNLHVNTIMPGKTDETPKLSTQKK